MPYVRASDGIRIHYSTTGRGHAPPVVMIQGLGADKNLWLPQRLALARRYRTIALDNRGAGRSDKPYGTYTLEQMADDAVAVLDHTGASDAHIVGASMGGVIAQILALKHRDRVRSLTLACTACTHQAWRRELLAEWAQIARERGMRAMTNNAARWTIGPRSFRRLSPAVGWLGPLAMSRPPHAFAAQVGAILAAPDGLHDELAGIEVPTLVMVGNQDILTPRGDSEEPAELVVISGAAHGFMIEHATTFNRILLDFLDRAEAAHRERLAPADARDEANAV
jgi:3-oxoadipate enol-lactonase